jgi:hypothetical protein
MKSSQVKVMISGKTCNYAGFGSGTFNSNGTYINTKGKVGRWSVDKHGHVHVDFPDGHHAWYGLGHDHLGNLKFGSARIACSSS